MYTCGRCGGAIHKDTKICPHCRANLAGIRCQNCHFVGGEAEFVNDRCPKCGQKVATAAETKPLVCKKCGSEDFNALTGRRCGTTQWSALVIVWVMGLGSLGCASTALQMVEGTTIVEVGMLLIFGVLGLTLTGFSLYATHLGFKSL